MIRIGCLALLSLLLIIGIVSCSKSSGPISTDRQTVDYIIIWFEGKSIKLENGNSNCDELYIEKQRAVKRLYFGCPVKTSVIDSIRQNEKCLEIVYKGPHPKFKDRDWMMFSELLRLSKELSKETGASYYTTYVEYSSGLGNSKSWEECWSHESRDELVKMVDKFLGVSH
jgi:hypothetical protein